MQHCFLLSRKSLRFLISGVRDGHRNRKSQKSLRLRCAKILAEILQNKSLESFLCYVFEIFNKVTSTRGFSLQSCCHWRVPSCKKGAKEFALSRAQFLVIFATYACTSLWEFRPRTKIFSPPHRHPPAPLPPPASSSNPPPPQNYNNFQ